MKLPVIINVSFPPISERQGVTIAMFSLTVGLLTMAGLRPALWDVEVFKVIIQAVVLTGILNMILAFHFAANKGDEDKSQNTGKAFDAIKATADAATQTAPTEDGARAASAVGDTAEEQAASITGDR